MESCLSWFGCMKNASPRSTNQQTRSFTVLIFFFLRLQYTTTARTLVLCFWNILPKYHVPATNSNIVYSQSKAVKMIPFWVSCLLGWTLTLANNYYNVSNDIYPEYPEFLLGMLLVTATMALMLHVGLAFSIDRVLRLLGKDPMTMTLSSQSETTPPLVTISVVRFPAIGNSPSIIHLPTTTHMVRVAPGLFPAHVPDVYRFWQIDPRWMLMRDWEIVQLRSQGWERADGKYMVLYMDDHLEVMPINHNIPKFFRPPRGIVRGDVFVAKLDRYHCGKHGWAEYEDIGGWFWGLDCMKSSKGGSRVCKEDASQPRCRASVRSIRRDEWIKERLQSQVQLQE